MRVPAGLEELPAAVRYWKRGAGRPSINSQGPHRSTTRAGQSGHLFPPLVQSKR